MSALGNCTSHVPMSQPKLPKQNQFIGHRNLEPLVPRRDTGIPYPQSLKGFQGQLGLLWHVGQGSTPLHLNLQK